MPNVTLNANTWTAVVTTSKDTAVQNRGSRSVYVTSEDTTSFTVIDGIELKPGEVIVFGAGSVAVRACSPEVVGRVWYCAVT